MKGFDNQALIYILSAMKQEEPSLEEAAATEIITLAMAYDLAYMQDKGIIADGEFTDVYYDDDEAFDFIVDKLSSALPETDPYILTDMLDSYFEYHDAYMEETGMLSWQ